MEEVRVSAYSGYRADERPRWVEWHGRRREVTEIQHEWREPEGRAFLVLLDGDERVRLLHREREDRWYAAPGG